MRSDVEEYVICSAVWYKELEFKREEPLRLRGISPFNVDKGIVFCGWRHANCIYQMVAMTGLRDCEAGESIQGFLTSKNMFLTREEARELAIKRGQVKEEKVSRILFSEDLY